MVTTSLTKYFSLEISDFPLMILLFVLVFLAPFNKVEESFHTQAIHDIIFHQENLHLYDHQLFPGVVPRTFSGDYIVAKLIKPLVPLIQFIFPPDFHPVSPKESILPIIPFTKDSSFLFNFYLSDKVVTMVLCRLLMAFFFFISMILFRSSFSHFLTQFYTKDHDCEINDQSSGSIPFYVSSFNYYFIFFSCFQFHVVFYASRFLSNSFALILINIALSFWIHGEISIFGKIPSDSKFAVRTTFNSTPSSNSSNPKLLFALSLITMGFTAAVFRCDLFPLLGFFVLVGLYRQIFPFSFVVFCGFFTLLLVLPTVVLDTYYWQNQHSWAQIETPFGRVTWPEIGVLKYNVIYSKSSNWGTEPFYWYFLKAIPKVCGFSLIPVTVCPILLIFSSGMQIADLKSLPSILLNKSNSHKKKSFPENIGTPSIPSKSNLNSLLLVICFWISLPQFLSILSLSFLPHKELRFIFWVFPTLSALSALSIVLFIEFSIRFSIVHTVLTFLFNPSFDKVWAVVKFLIGGLVLGQTSSLSTGNSMSYQKLMKLFNEPPLSMKILLWGIQAGCIFLFSLFLFASIHNYPGGISALRIPHLPPAEQTYFSEESQNEEHVQENAQILSIYFDNFACQTGLSRFLERYNWKVIKSGQQSDDPQFDPASDDKGIGGIYVSDSKQKFEKDIIDIIKNNPNIDFFVVSDPELFQQQIESTNTIHKYVPIDTIYMFGGVSHILSNIKQSVYTFSIPSISSILVPALTIFGRI